MTDRKDKEDKKPGQRSGFVRSVRLVWRSWTPLSPLKKMTLRASRRIAPTLTD